MKTYAPVRFPENANIEAKQEFTAISKAIFLTVEEQLKADGFRYWNDSLAFWEIGDTNFILQLDYDHGYHHWSIENTSNSVVANNKLCLLTDPVKFSDFLFNCGVLEKEVNILSTNLKSLTFSQLEERFQIEKTRLNYESAEETAKELNLRLPKKFLVEWWYAPDSPMEQEFAECNFDEAISLMEDLDNEKLWVQPTLSLVKENKYDAYLGNYTTDDF